MSQPRSHSPSNTGPAKSVNDAQIDSKRQEVITLTKRVTSLLNCMSRVETIRLLLLEARQDAESSECHGILFRIDSQLKKIKTLQGHLTFKRDRLRQRIGVLNGD